jgi:hypothetical protein
MVVIAVEIMVMMLDDDVGHAYADDSQLYTSFRPDSEASQRSAVKATELCICDIKHGW